MHDTALNQILNSPISKRKFGNISTSNKGFGFIRTEDLEEYYVAAPLMRQFITGDFVSFTTKLNAKNQTEAKDILLVERKASLAIGTVEEKNGRLQLIPDEPCSVPLYLQGITSIPSDIVVAVTIPASHRLSHNVYVRLERILGKREQKNFEHDYALARQGFNPYFSYQTMKCAPLPETTAIHEDLTSVPFVTIDGKMSKDLDDALFIQRKADEYLLQIAIADVSFYVQEGTPIDEEARKRGTSVYLPEKVIPMLPEYLSNGECSLLPDVVRKAVVLQLTIGRTGEILHTSVTRALIKSISQLNYTQVTQALEEGAWTGLNSETQLNLEVLKELYEILAKNRKTRGVMDFEDPEPYLIKKNDGTSTIAWNQRTIAHKMVEESMLLANQAVAKLIWDKFGHGMFRHQPAPTAEAWTELKVWASSAGYELDNTPSLQALNELRQRVPEQMQDEVDLQIRQIMQPAKYAANLSNHFSLGFPEYTHFTSPIRRYSDLIVHRILLAEHRVNNTKLMEQAEWCSNRAKAARTAERYVWDWLKKTIMMKEEDQTANLEATLVLQSRKGLRVVIKAWQCSALIPEVSLLKYGYTWDKGEEKWITAKNEPLQMGANSQVQLRRLEITKQICEVFCELAAP